MPLPDSIILTDGTTPETFTNKVRNGNVVTYFATSPAGDLAGRPTLEFTQALTKAGIAKATVVLTRPLLNATTGKYDKFNKTTETSTMAADQSVALREKDIKKLSSLNASYADEIAAGDL